jgi:fibronectin-binding autotransporter adhesin
LTVYGMLSLEGTATASSSGSPIFGPGASLRYRGSVAQATGPEFPSSFGSAGGVIIDNSNGVTLTASKTISSLLTFINGKITTGTNALIMGASSTVSGAGTGKYIYGNLQKDIGTGTVSKTFEIGDASAYAPVTIEFTGTTNGTGSILFYTTQGDHPNISSSSINPASSVNRYWTAANNGVTGFTSYSVTLNFVPGDLDASADYNAFIIGNYTGGAWNYPAVGTRTSSSTQASGLTTFGALQIGNAYMEYRSAATGAWDQLSTWEVFNGTSWNPATSIPASSAGTVTLRTPYTITVNTNPVIDQVVIDAGATLLLSSGAVLADGPGTDMSVSGTIDCISTLTGAGSFDLLAGGTIIIKSPDGITSSGLTGNIQTSLRNFNAGANYIYNGATAQVTGSGLPATVNNLTINNAAGVTLTGPVTLNGVLNLDTGVLTSGSSSITFQNSDIPIARTTGTITTSSATDITFGTPGNTAGAAFSIPSGTFTASPVINNFTVNRTNTLTLNDQVLSVSGIVLCNGPLNTNGNMVLLSTVSQTALISGSGTGSVTGNVSMQRYLPSGFGYKYFSSPFQAATVAEFGDDMDLGASFTTFYRFEENRLVGGVPASGWVSYKVTTNVLNPMTGYAVNFGSNPASNTVDITGAVNNGPLSVTLYNHNQIYTTGFNLVGNPYPSPVDWNAAGWTKTNIDNTVYYFKATDQYGGTYSTYNGVTSSDGLATNIIPSMQGFFVHVSDGAYPVTGSLGMTNSIRINDLTHAFLKKGKAGPSQLIRIAASFTDDANSTDPAVIYFEEFATDAMDSKYDALKLMNTDVKVPNIFSMISGGRKLSINALPFLTGSSLQVSLGIRANRAGTIRFRILDIDETTASLGVSLFDAVTGISQNLLGVNEYQVTLATGEYLNRFYLNLGSVITGAQMEKKTGPLFDIYITKGILRAEIETMPGPKGELILYNILGQPVIKERINGPGIYEFSTGLKDGLYIATLISGDQKYAKKIFIRGQ